MADENEYVQGPGPDYDPPPIDDLVDPETRSNVHSRGRALVLRVLAEIGTRKLPSGKWTRDEGSTSKDAGT